MEISPEKSETMEFLGRDLVRFEIVVDNKCLQQVNNFKCLNCEISYGNKNDLRQKVTKFSQILGILSNTFKPTLVKKFSRIKVCNTLALPMLVYGSKIWILRKEDKK
jgi:acetylglutamate synthase